MARGTLKMDNALGVLTTVSTEAVMEADMAFAVEMQDISPLASAWGESRVRRKNAALTFRGFQTLVMDKIIWDAWGQTRTFEFTQNNGPSFSFEGTLVAFNPSIPLGGFNGWQATVVSQGAVTRTSPLLTYLISHWKLDETSGQRNDSHGSNHLTDNNTVTSVTGLLDKAASFASASSESLSIADNASTSIGTGISFGFAGAVKLTTKSASMTIVGKYAGGPSTTEYALRYENGTDRFTTYVSDGVSNATVPDAVLGSPSTGVWYFIFFGYDATVGKAFLQINNGEKQYSSAHAGAQDSTNTLTFGAQSGGGSHLNGAMDSWSFFKGGLPSDALMTSLYNNGLLLDYSF